MEQDLRKKILYQKLRSDEYSAVSKEKPSFLDNIRKYNTLQQE